MADDLRAFPVGLTGGLQQSRAQAQPGDFQTLENVGIFRGRLGLRAPLTEIATLKDDQATPVEVTGILDIVNHEQKMFVVSHSNNTNKVYLHSLAVDGTSVTRLATIWTSVSVEPIVTTASVEGGTTSGPTDRLYISDYNQNNVTKYWDGSALQTVSEDLDNDSSDENVTFSIVHTFKFHLWGTGFYETDANYRPELLRFSQPGLIPGSDIAGGNNPKEWFSADHRSVGDRGDKIKAIGTAGDRMIVCQGRRTHSIFGYGGTSWQKQVLSRKVGCVGPHAITETDQDVVAFWSDDGPYVSNGQNLEYIGGPIRQTAVDVEADAAVQAGYSPDDGIVYFFVKPAGTTEATRPLKFDLRNRRWVGEGDLLTGASTILAAGAVADLDAEAPPPPDAAPSSLTATAVDDTSVDLAWTNGDTAIDTTTHIHRGTSAGFTVGVSNEIREVDSGVTTHTDTGLSSATTYYYKVRHERNNQFSSNSNEASVTTAASEPTNFSTRGLSSGEELSFTNNEAGADIEIERKPSGGSFSSVTTLTNQSSGSITYDDTSATCGTAYTWRIRANDTGTPASTWVESSATACVSDTAPTAPSSLSLTRDTDTQFTIDWTDNSDNEDAFEIHRQYNGGGFTQYDTVGVNVTSYTDSGLNVGDTYDYKVRATNEAGDSSFSNEVGDTAGDTPDAPSGMSATKDSTNNTSQINLVWTDNSADETSFEIHRSTDGGGSYTLLDSVGADVTTYSDTGLDDNSTYYYKVRACNSLGCSGFSNSDSATTDQTPPPDAPSNLSATEAGTDQIDLTWTDNSSDEDDFELHRSTDGGSTYSLHATLAANTTSYSDTGLSSSTTYYYKVRACHDVNGCSAFTSPANATTADATTIPASPSSLSATSGGSDNIDLSWTDNSNDEDDFEIHRSTDGGSTYSLLTSVAANTTTYNDSGLTDETQYCYKVRACNTAGCSDFSNSDCATTDAVVPSAPSSLSATASSTSEIDLSWTDNSNNEDEFEIHRDGALLTTVGANTTTYTDTGLSSSTQYCYEVRACNTAGCSAFSNQDCATTDATLNPPSAPSSLSATAVSTSQIDLSWTDNSANENEFRIERESPTGGGFSQITTVGADVTSYSDTGLTDDTQYNYRVRACNADGCSSYSNEASATTDAAETIPSAPSSLSASAISSSQISLSWTDNSNNEDSFRIYRDGSWVATNSANDTTYTDSGLNASTSYSYTVRACNTAGCSSHSNTASATTDENAPAAPSSMSATAVSSSEISLSWTDNSSNEDDFEIYRGGSLLTTVGANTTSYSDTSLNAGTQYCYKVRACNTGGCSSFSNEDCATTDNPQPSSLTATDTSFCQDFGGDFQTRTAEVKISWTNGSTSSVSHIEIWRDGSELTTVAATVSSYEDQSVSFSTQYCYKVRYEFDDGTHSAYSNQDCATPDDNFACS